ncbi:MAG: threonine--tRNA ligase [Candidatus Aenigmarchaeota archaeon]|nr:threonine--tRNA ligase [Candidatus Aenigmarchaeota archaeon]
MKILLLHSDFIEWEPKKKAVPMAEDVEKKPKKVNEALVVFTAVEKSDEKDQEKVVRNSIKEILDVFRQVKAKTIVLYPYAHLSSDLAQPSVALKVLKDMESDLGKKAPVVRAPFGWYKAFNLKCKGHPLSELSKSISAEGAAAPAAKGRVSQEPERGSFQQDEKIDPHQLLREISKSKLDRELLKENDHRILGQRMDLFSFSDGAPGMVFWHDKGWTLYNELISFWREEHRKAGYQEISTPVVLDKKLWQISGHWEKYRENIFLTKYENRDFAVKPMNCPGALLVYKSRPKSYRDLPLRIAELGVVHRHELSGVLTGLFRAIKFTQDDAHIFCTEDQLENEIVGIMDMVDRFYRKFGFDYHVELSTRPEKRIGNDKFWDKAERILEDVLKKKKIKYKINKGDGAFYGPKIDFHIKDSQGRTWQCATIQLDFAMPERFEITYTGEDNNPHTPVMIHRVVYGAIERFIGVLLEHLNGNLPVWLSPVQVRVLSFTERNNPAAKKVHEKFLEAGIRAELDIENRTVEHKVRDAELQKIPYMIVIGDKEENSKSIAVRTRGDKKVQFGVRLDSFISKVCEEIRKRGFVPTGKA